jgi:hypothetical protein
MAAKTGDWKQSADKIDREAIDAKMDQESTAGGDHRAAVASLAHCLGDVCRMDLKSFGCDAKGSAASDQDDDSYHSITLPIVNRSDSIDMLSYWIPKYIFGFCVQKLYC